jgi:hypothetical protein
MLFFEIHNLNYKKYKYGLVSSFIQAILTRQGLHRQLIPHIQKYYIMLIMQNSPKPTV